MIKQTIANSQFPQTKQIEKIISKRYNNRLQFLGLRTNWSKTECLNRQWKKVIQYRNWSNLRSLWIMHCEIKESDVHVITDFPWLNLQYFNISDNQIGDSGVCKILNSNLPKLVQLKLQNNNITPYGLHYFPSFSTTTLKQLSLSKNHIGIHGSNLLIKASLLNLESIELSTNKYNICNCYLNNKGLKNICKSFWPNLKQIHLIDNYIGLDGYSAMLEFYLKSVKYLRIGYNQASYFLVLFVLTDTSNYVFLKFGSFNYSKWIQELLMKAMKQRFFSGNLY